jgi:hypothetical protein
MQGLDGGSRVWMDGLRSGWKEYTILSFQLGSPVLEPCLKPHLRVARVPDPSVLAVAREAPARTQPHALPVMLAGVPGARIAHCSHQRNTRLRASSLHALAGTPRRARGIHAAIMLTRQAREIARSGGEGGCKRWQILMV